jgi:signal transduction histidine kinase/CheY-like chemotaxis protein
MIVEDEGITALSIEKSLKKMGYEVTSSVSSGEEAVNRATKNKPDLILMDIALAGKMDGIEVAEQIRAIINIPVIYITAHSDDKMMKRIKMTEPFGYIIKPFEDQELRFAVEIALYKHNMEEQLRKNEKELKKHRDHLEELVKERTAELSSAVDLLLEEIHHHKSTEVKLKDSEKRYRELFNYMSSGVAVYEAVENGKNFIFRDFNKAGENIDDIKKEALLGKKVTDVFPGIKELGLFNMFQSVWKTGKPEHLPVSMYKDHRISGWRENYIYKLPSGEIVAVYNDVTESKVAREEAIRASHLAALGELAAGVAHEINNPINGVINYTQLLANKSKKGSDEYNIAIRIIKEGDRIAGIVHNLLSFARDRKGEKTPTTVRDIWQDAIALTKTQMKNDGIKLVVHMPSSSPTITANPQQIEQVFLNIISNARYALNEKYPGSHEDKMFEVSCNKTTVNTVPCVRITFYDRGTGIPGKIIDRIMNPFFTTKSSTYGTGLGLSISHGIISDHGGKLSISSVEGEFTKVIIDLPVRPDTKRTPDRK